LLHALVLLGDKYIGYTLPQILIPFASVGYQPLWVGLGQIGLYMMALVTLSFYVRRWIGARTWRLIHFLSFAVFALALVHGLFSGTDSSTPWALGMYLGSAVTATALQAPAAAAATTTQAAQPASVAGAVYQKVGPSVVEVLVAGPSTRFGRTQSGSGSGIVIDSSGYILTNNHVVAGAASIRVRFSDGQERTAQVVGTDSGNDLALIKADLPANTPVATLGDSDQVQVGDTAIAIG